MHDSIEGTLCPQFPFTCKAVWGVQQVIIWQGGNFSENKMNQYTFNELANMHLIYTAAGKNYTNVCRALSWLVRTIASNVFKCSSTIVADLQVH